MSTLFNRTQLTIFGPDPWLLDRWCLPSPDHSGSWRVGCSLPRKRCFLLLLCSLHQPRLVSSYYPYFYSSTDRLLTEYRGFAVGWDYAISWLVILPFEITAASLTIQFWRDDLNMGIWVAVFLVILSAIQFFGVRGYGEGKTSVLKHKFGSRPLLTHLFHSRVRPRSHQSRRCHRFHHPRSRDRLRWCP